MCKRIVYIKKTVPWLGKDYTTKYKPASVEQYLGIKAAIQDSLLHSLKQHAV